MKKIVIALMTAVLMSLTIAAVVTAGGDQKALQVVLGDETLLAYASTSGAGGNSGRIWTANGHVNGNRIDVLVKASWNWSFYNSDHPAALVNTTTKDFDGCRVGQICAAGIDFSATVDLTQGVIPGALTDDYARGKVRRGHPDGFRTDATVTITTPHGVINGVIVSGSVYEIAVPGTGGGGSINEWLIGFDIVGGTGGHVGATGTGVIHKVWDSGSAYSDTPGVYVDDPARFLVHEMFLHLD